LTWETDQREVVADQSLELEAAAITVSLAADVGVSFECLLPPGLGGVAGE
jgi:hypothetical protein